MGVPLTQTPQSREATPSPPVSPVSSISPTSPVSPIEITTSTDAFGKKIELISIRENSLPTDLQSQSSSTQTLVPDQTVQFWNPRSLSRPALLAFVVLFTLILISLQIVDSYAAKHRGLAAADQTKHFLWTFGPTSVFIVIAALWRQVDYQTKQLMPWAQMSKGASSADQSLLLDYTSPLMVISFLKSLRNRHLPVALTILGFALIKVLTVLSTGLLVLQYVSAITSSADFVITNKFDAANFAQGQIVDSRPIFRVYGAENKDMTNSPGTTDYFAVQSFEADRQSRIPSGAELVASVDVFGADLDCEVADMSYDNATNYWLDDGTIMEYLDLSVSTPSCQVNYKRLNVSEPSGIVSNADYRSLFEIVECKIPASKTKSRRLLAAVAFIKEVENTQSMVNSSALLCTPSYRIMKGTVAINSSDSSGSEVRVDSVDESRSRVLPDLSALDLTTGVQQSALLAQSVGNIDEGSSLGSFMGMAFAHSHVSMAEFMSSQIMIKESRHLFRLVSTQIAAEYLMAPNRENIEGSYNQFGSLLVPRQVPLRTMQALLAILIIVASVLLFIIPRDVLPRSAESIGGLATILARSQEAMKPLKGLGHVSSETLEVLLQSTSFKTSVQQHPDGPVFQIERVEGCGLKRRSTHTRRKPVSFSPKKWWRPLSFSYPAIISTLLLPIGLISALQATLDKSVKEDGLFDVDPSSGSRAGWVYIPALVLVLTATLFNVLDFDVATVQPYQTLKKRGASAIESVTQRPLLRVAIFRLYSRLTSNYFPVMITAVAVIIAPMLTIVVSSLLFLQQVPYSRSIEASRLTWFNDTPLQEFSPSEAANTVNLIVHGNMTYPRWTYGELAFPNISIQSLAEFPLPYLDKAQRLEVVLPALRGRFNCTPWPINKLEYRSLDALDSVDPEDLDSFTETEPGYIAVDGSRILLTLPDDIWGNIGIGGKPMSHFDFTFENVTSRDGNGFSASDALQAKLLFFGQFNNHKLDNFTITHCSPYVESLDVETSLNLRDYTLVSNSPPQAREDSAKIFTDSATTESTGSDIATLNLALSPLNLTDGHALSPFFQALVYGREGIPASELLNQTHLIHAADHLHSLVKAQTLNAYNRIPAPKAKNALNATYIYTERIRLQQWTLATRLLQVLLIILLICAMLVHSIIWLDTDGSRRIMPRNPHSIGSVACLLAGSQMLEESVVPRGTEWLSDKKIGERGVWSRWRFGMGWWSTNGNGDGNGNEQDAGVAGPGRFGIDVGDEPRGQEGAAGNGGARQA